MNALKSEFDRRGVPIVVISFAEPAKLASYRDRHPWPFKLLADPERKAYAAVNLQGLSWYRVFSPATLALYFKLNRRGMKQERYGGDDIYQSGGDFLVDRRGDILFAHRSRDPADRPTPARLLEEIDRALSLR